MTIAAPSTITAARCVFRLALADFRHDWRNFACLALALAAVLAPLLVLGGLKAGIVTGMRDRLTSDPAALEVVLVGSNSLAPDWFDALSKRPESGFFIPRTRSLAATADLIGANGKSLSGVELVPTRTGDPLLGSHPAPASDGELLLSQSAAARLGARAGDEITALVSRRLGGEQQALRAPMKIAAILDERFFTRDGAFVTLDFLVRLEDFRDGGDAARQPLEKRAFASARLYAKRLDDVAPLAAWLREQGLEARTKADDIAAIQAIDRTLSLVLAVIAGLSVGGYLLSLASSLWANVERKRRELALLRLIGFPGKSIIVFPVAEALLIALIGIVLSVGAAFVVSLLFNALFANAFAANEFVCRLLPTDLALAGFLTLVLAFFASILGGYRAFSIDPAESLREI